MLGSLRHAARVREREIELMPFWKTFATPLVLVTSAAVFLLTFLVVLFKFNELPAKIPFQYNAINGTWVQADKSVLLFLPILVVAVEAIIIRVVYETFQYDPRLSKMISWILAVVNLLLLITYGQILSLVQPI